MSQIQDLDISRIEPTMRANIEFILDRRDRLSGPVYLVTVRSVVRRAIQLSFGDGGDYREKRTRLHQYVAGLIEERGGVVWGLAATQEDYNRFADRVYQITKGAEKT